MGGRGVQDLQRFRVGEEESRDRMLAGTLKCATGVCATEGAWGPAWALVSNRYHRQPLVPSSVIREKALASFGRGNLLYTFLRHACFCLPSRNWGDFHLDLT